MSDDNLRDILGDELFDELQQLSPEDVELEMNLLGEIELPQELLDIIADTEYRITIPIQGSTLLDAVSALMHAAEEDCQNCLKFATELSIRIIAQLWISVMQTEGIIKPGDIE